MLIFLVGSTRMCLLVSLGAVWLLELSFLGSDLFLTRFWVFFEFWEVTVM